MSNTTKILLAFIACLGLIGGFSIYRQARQRRACVDMTIESLKKQIIQTQSAHQLVSSSAIETKSWGALQGQLRDTVVQVFSEVADFNWLEPYKSPNQYSTSGSGFFINDLGQIITNAHVVDQAKGISIQIPSFGKRRFMVERVGVSPDRDLALLSLDDKDRQEIKMVLGKIPVLPIGDSDQVHRADELMALGFPLGQQSLKGTTGIVSGRQHIDGQHLIQISAAINPGSSGGPSINHLGQCIGVNSSGVAAAQNVGYVIPSSEVQLFLHHLSQLSNGTSPKFLRKPFLGILFHPASESLTEFLKNPTPGGLYVAGTPKNSTLEKAGIKIGDMIYEIDGYRLDLFGEMNVPWSEDKISVLDYIARLTIGDKVHLRFYRNGVEHNLSLTFSEPVLAPVRVMHPEHELIDYEITSGLVIMPLALNHLPLLGPVAPELIRYREIQNQNEGALVITHIFPTSVAAQSRTLTIGTVISEVNGKRVNTLQDLRDELKNSQKTKFLTIKTQQNVFVVLPFDVALKEERRLSQTFLYPLSPFTKQLLTSTKTHETKKKA